MSISRNILSAKRRGQRQAFTLVEVTLALIILMLLVGVVYAIVDTTLRAASGLEERQDRNRELSAFLSLCRKTFRTMPATATFEARVVSSGLKSAPELIFRNAPGVMAWGDGQDATVSTILGVRGQVGGLVSVGILQDSEEQISSYLKGGTASRPWLLLLSDIRDADWQFFDSKNRVWVKEWSDQSSRPSCAELTLTTAEGTEKYTFWLPPVVKSRQQGGT